MKHYEDVWEESEQIALEYAELNSEYDPVSNISTYTTEMIADGLTLEEREALMGKILISLCYLSGKYEGLNTWHALRQASNDLKVELMEPDLE